MATVYVADGYVADGYVQTGITVNWGIKEIFVPKSEMILVQSTPIKIYQLNLNDFRKALNDAEDAEDGIIFLDTHDHVQPISVGGVDLARVVSIINDYTITFEDGQYAVNLVGANSNVGDRVNVNQVSVRSANSAGLPDLEALQTAAFGGAVHYKTGSPYSGTTYPIGTNGYPVNNFPDARLIAAKYNLDTVQSWGDASLGLGDDISYFNFLGQNTLLSSFIIDTLADTYGTHIINASITGSLDGGAILENSNITNLNYVNGEIIGCTLMEGIISLSGTGDATFKRCMSGKAGQLTPTIIGSPNVNLIMRGYDGGIELRNFSNGTQSSIDLASGQVKIDLTTCDNCEITIRGDGKVYDTAGNHLSSGTYNNGLIIYNEASSGEHLHDIWNSLELNVNSSYILTDRIWSKDITTWEDITGTAAHHLKHIRYLSRVVWIDTELLVNGDGSEENPFNLLNDALDYAEVQGIKTIAVMADITLDRNLKNFKIMGVGTPTVDTNNNDLSKSEFYHCKMEGNYIGRITVQESVLLNGFWLNGYFENCGLAGDLFCIDGGEVLIKDSASVIAGIQRPSISMNGVGSSNLSLRSYSGGMTIKDCNNPLDNITVEVREGSLTFDASNTSGIMVARGMCSFVNLTGRGEAEGLYDETIGRDIIGSLVWDELLTAPLIGSYGARVNSIPTVEEISFQVNTDMYTVNEIAQGVWGLDNSSPIAGSYGETLTASFATPLEIASAVWAADSDTNSVTGSMGHYLQKGVLSFKKFMGVYKK